MIIPACPGVLWKPTAPHPSDGAAAEHPMEQGADHMIRFNDETPERIMIMPTLNLAGVWNHRTDHDDRGLTEQWQSQHFNANPFTLPGTATTNHVGTPLEYEPKLNEWTTRSPRQRYEYTGALWLQRDITMPDWAGLGVQLELERVIFDSTVWIDGHWAGRQDSLSVTHTHDLAAHAKPGETQTLTIRIDNRDIHNILDKASAYTNETQTIWNGIVGGIRLTPTPPVTRLIVNPQPDGRILASFQSNQPARAMTVRISDETNTIVAAADMTVQPGDNTIQLTIPNPREWDEHDPRLYRLAVTSGTETATTMFGLRTLTVQDRQITVNGRRVFLRGTLDCCVYPKTGYPPCDVESYRQIFRKIKKLGLNHVRYHSWCPPEAAFDAADQLGVYLSIEGPFWMDDWFNGNVGWHADHYEYMEQELTRIIDAYGNHPSFIMLAVGNELSGDYTYLEDMLQRVRQHDRHRRLTTITSNSGCVVFHREPTSVDDFFVDVQYQGTGIRGQAFLDQMVEETTLTYDQTVRDAPLPLIAHELGQYAVFPDISEIPEYDGALAPVNLDVIAADLHAKGLDGHAKDYVLASGHLAAELYRDDIEATLRTHHFGGFQMLDLHDFPGQSTATVGLLNAFWESKGIDNMDLHCRPVTPLLIMGKRQYWSTDTLQATLKVFNYGNGDVPAGRWYWSLNAVDTDTLLEGHVDAGAAPQGDLTEIGSLSIDLKAFDKDTKAVLTVTNTEAGCSNSWDIWVYQPKPSSWFDDTVTVGDTYDDAVRVTLEAGGKAVILADPNRMTKVRKGEFFPVFWSPVWFKSVDPCGMFCQQDHPLFDGFPTGRYADLNWKDPLENSFGMIIDGLGPGFEPVTEIVPNFYTIEHATNLFECRVGEGRLLVCSIDLTRTDMPSILSLRNSIVSYVNGDEFNPVQTIDGRKLDALLNAKPMDEEPRERNIALRKPASTDGSKSKSRGPERAVDGSPLTFWESINSLTGHWWQVDLEEQRTIHRICITLQEPQDTQLIIESSDDGVHYARIIDERADARIRVFEFPPRSCRFVKVTFNQPNTMGAGMVDFSVS